MTDPDGEAVPAPRAPQLRAAREALDAAIGHLPIEVLCRARESQWSGAQILEHLTLAFRVNAAALDRALASGELRPRIPLLRQKLARMLVVDLGYFPKVRAPEVTVPCGSIPPETSVLAVRQALTALDGVLTRVAGRFGSDVPAANHPYFGGMSVAQWRKFHWRHTVHHVRQVRARS